MDLDFGNLDIDFGSVKPLPQIPEGDYNMTIVDWEISAPQRAESAAKGANLRVKFRFTDSEYVDKNGVHDISVIQPNCLIYFMFNNPFALLPLISAIKGVDKSDPSKIGTISGATLQDKSEWIGEQVIARLIRQEATNGKVYLNPVPDAFMPVPF